MCIESVARERVPPNCQICKEHFKSVLIRESCANS